MVIWKMVVKWKKGHGLSMDITNFRWTPCHPYDLLFHCLVVDLPLWKIWNPRFYESYPILSLSFRLNMVQLYLVGGIPKPLWKMMENSSVGMMTFPISEKECFKPPTSPGCDINLATKNGKVWLILLLRTYHFFIAQSPIQQWDSGRNSCFSWLSTFLIPTSYYICMYHGSMPHHFAGQVDVYLPMSDYPLVDADYPLVDGYITNWKSTILWWVNQRTKWSCSISFCMFTRGYPTKDIRG